MSGEFTGLDLGHGHTLRYIGWAPDRALNPHHAHLPDVDRYCAEISHPKPADGTPCSGAVTFAGPVQREIDPDHAVWTVDSWEPLTLSPSVLCMLCGDHGFVRDGRWVPA